MIAHDQCESLGDLLEALADPFADWCDGTVDAGDEPREERQ